MTKSEARIEEWKNPIIRKHRISGLKKAWQKIKLEGRIIVGHKHSEKTKRHLGNIRRGMKFSETWRKNIGKSMIGKPGHHNTKHSEKTKRLISKMVKLGQSKGACSRGAYKRWANPEYREKKIKDWFEKIKMKPNKLETDFDNFLQQHFPNEWKYVGDGQIFINGRVPDWININGKKQLIEMFGDYFHKQEDEKIRKKHFAKYGYKTKIFWEHEFRKTPNKILKALRN